MTSKFAFAALAIACAFAAPAQAAAVSLTGDGAWNEFTVDDQLATDGGTEWISTADGSPLSFLVTIAPGTVGTLTVVDAGFAGDTFRLTNYGSAFGQTSGVPQGSLADPTVIDFDLALADPRFSSGVFTLAAGTYSLSGSLLQSVLLAPGVPLDSTYGGLRLDITSAVPEPATTALLAAGLALVGLRSRRLRRHTA